MAMVQSKGMPVGTPAPPFSLPGVDGGTWSLEDFRDAQVLVVIFTCNHCPVAVASEDRFVALSRDYAPRGVRLVAINPNDVRTHPTDSMEHMQERARDKGFDFPYLRDDTQEVARAYDAACTPDIFAFDGERKLRYNGRLDDNWKDPSAASRHDLRRALDAILAGEPISFDVVPSIGCSIKWR